MKKRYLLLWLGMLAVAFMLNACGGGGGGSSVTEASGSNWDEMQWDQGKWK